MNLKKIVKISKLLDNKGLFAIADKIDQFVKVAQYAKVPSQYESTPFPRTGNPLIDAAFTDLKNSAFGYQLAGGNQFERTSPYKSEFGPSGPAILPTLSPEEFAQMEKEGRFQEIFNLQMQGGLQAQNYLALTNENLIGLADVIRKYSQASKNVRESFFNYVLPGTISTMVSQDLEVRPIAQWSSRLNEYLSVLGDAAPSQISMIRNSIGSALNAIMKNKKFESKAAFNQLTNDPKWKSLSKDLNIKAPETLATSKPANAGPANTNSNTTKDLKDVQ